MDCPKKFFEEFKKASEISIISENAHYKTFNIMDYVCFPDSYSKWKVMVIMTYWQEE